MNLWAWSPARRATVGHIRDSIRHALWEKAFIATKTDEWYAGASQISRDWRDGVRGKSVKQLAREHLEYWRHRAYLHDGIGDRRAYRRWQRFCRPAVTQEPSTIMGEDGIPEFAARWRCPDCGTVNNDTIHPLHGPFLTCICGHCQRTFTDDPDAGRYPLDKASAGSLETARRAAERYAVKHLGA
jgi:hypothetical protein